MGYLDDNGLLYLWQKIKTKFVLKEFKTGSTTAYKVLSDNNLTDELVTKIQNAGDSSFTGDYNDLTNKPTIPTNNNELTNGMGYQTSEQVQNAIATALTDITGITYEVIEELPSAGQAGVIYLKSNSGTNPNIYDEYIYVNNAFEKIGTTEADLTGYLQSAQTISNSTIDTLLT